MIAKVSIEFFSMEKYEEAAALWKNDKNINFTMADSRENISKYLDRNKGFSFVALDENRLIGTVLGGHDGRRGYVHHLFVVNNYRQRGIGRSLLERCLHELKKEGLAKVHIFVFDINEEGRNFWSNINWEEREDIKVFSFSL